MVGRQPQAPVAFTPRGIPGTHFLEAELTPGHMVLSVSTRKIPVTDATRIRSRDRPTISRVFYLWGAAKSAAYCDRQRKVNELKTAITVYIRNISQADLQKTFANNIKRVQPVWTLVDITCNSFIIYTYFIIQSYTSLYIIRLY